MGFKAQTTIIKVIKNDMKIKSVSTISSTSINQGKKLKSLKLIKVN